MSNIQNLVITISFLLWIFTVTFELIVNKETRSTKGYLVALGKILLIVPIAYGLHTLFGYYSTLEIKGRQGLGEGWTLLILYISTLFGMIGHHIFMQVSALDVSETEEPQQLPEPLFSDPQKNKKRLKLQWIFMLKPLAVSPIIFISVLSQLNKMSAQANTIESVVMQVLLAFQSGFFWETIFAQAQKEQVKKSRKKGRT